MIISSPFSGIKFKEDGLWIITVIWIAEVQISKIWCLCAFYNLYYTKYMAYIIQMKNLW